MIPTRYARPSLMHQMRNIASFELRRFLKDRKTITIPIISIVPLIFIAFGPNISMNNVNNTFSSVIVTFGLGITIISGLLFANETVVTESESKIISLWITQPIRRETLFFTRGLVLSFMLSLEGFIFSFSTWILIALKANLFSMDYIANGALWTFAEVLLKVWSWYVLVAIFYSYLFILLALITPNNFLLIGFLVGFGEVFILTILFPITLTTTTLSPFLHFINLLDILIHQRSTLLVPLTLSLGYIILLTTVEIIILLYYVSQKNFH